MTPDQLDRVTLRISQCFALVLTKYPDRTSAGVLLGLLLAFGAERLAPALQSISFMDFTDVAWWKWLAPGLFVMHVRTIASAFKVQSLGYPMIDLQMELMERENFSPAERKQRIKEILNRLTEEALTAQLKRSASRPSDLSVD